MQGWGPSGPALGHPTPFARTLLIAQIERFPVCGEVPSETRGTVGQEQTAASKPSPNNVTLPPIVIGMTPEMGPPLAAAAGVWSV